MSVYKEKRTGSYCYRFMYKGVLYHRCFKGAKRDEVASYEFVARSELIKNGYDISTRKDYSLYDIFEDYKQYANNTYTKPEEAIKIVSKFVNFTGNKLANQVILGDIERFRSTLIGVVKNSSINRMMNNVKKMFSLAKTNKKIEQNPCAELKPLRIDNPQKRFLEKDEEQILLQHASPLMKAFIIIGIQSGMRIGEIINLQCADVFFREQYLIARNTKNGKPRKLLITKDMEEQLKLFYNPDNIFVFTNPRTGDRYKDTKSCFQRLVKKSGIPHITFHELRHTTASRMNELGIDLATIQEYLDHEDPRTTRGYIHKPKQNILDAVRKLSEY